MNIQEKRKKHADYMRAYNKNPIPHQKKLLRDRQYAKEHSQQAIKKASLWNKKHREHRQKYLKEYFQKTKELRREMKNNYERGYSNRKWHNDINWKLKKILRNRIRACIKDNKKGGSAVKDIGCTLNELICHIEKQFVNGMTWSNWSAKGWHIDHIKPLSLFNLQDRKQFLEACHYTNLQPLWSEMNIRKSNKYVLSPPVDGA